MNLQALDSLRQNTHSAYIRFLLDEWELDLQPRSKLIPNPYRIEVTCFSTKDAHGERIPLGEPLSYTLTEAARFGPKELERMLEHIRLSINLNKLI